MPYFVDFERNDQTNFINLITFINHNFKAETQILEKKETVFRFEKKNG